MRTCGDRVGLASDCLRQRVFDRGCAVKVELASENENRCFARVPLEGEREIVLHGAPSGGIASDLRRAPPARVATSGGACFLSLHTLVTM